MHYHITEQDQHGLQQRRKYKVDF